jgi:hypothetical protein
MYHIQTICIDSTDQYAPALCPAQGQALDWAGAKLQEFQHHCCWLPPARYLRPACPNLMDSNEQDVIENNYWTTVVSRPHPFT